jgi:hypothetical protein
MHVPPEVDEVLRNFHQGLMYDRFASVEEMVERALVGTNERQRKAVAAFLDELLSEQRSADELQRIWWQTSADIFFPDEQGLLALLNALRAAVTAPRT